MNEPEVRVARLEEMVRGWFVGDFNPSVLKTQACEVAVRNHPAGDFEETHYHKIACLDASNIASCTRHLLAKIHTAARTTEMV